MTSGDEDVDSLAADLFTTTEYAPSRPERPEFQPWHRPRKQFVRRHQWLKQIMQLGDSAGNPLRYLGLPGTDLLDLRFFHRELCEPAKRTMTFLGFNRALTAGDPGLNTSLDEVRRLPYVDSRSEVLGEDFRLLANTTSIAWKRAVDLGPFDVINLDLCDSLATDVPAAGSLYEAVQQLMALQIRNPHPWLFLLTTRVGRSHMESEVVDRLALHVRQNASGCDAFVDKCREVFQVDAAGFAIGQCSDAQFFGLMVVGMCKWIAALILAATGSPSRVELASSLAYTVNPTAAHFDLVSFALRVRPILTPNRDAAGLATAAPTAVDECRIATKIVHRVGKTVAVDELINKNIDLRQTLVKELESILSLARYATADYREWLARIEPDE